MNKIQKNLKISLKDSILPNKHRSIYRELRWGIATLVYKPGVLLSENMLSQKFGISRTPIRKILQELEQDHFVEIHFGSGTYVTPIDYYNFDEIFQLRIGLIQLMEQLSPTPTLSEHLIEIDRLINKIKIPPCNLLELALITTEFYEFALQFIGNKPLRDICEFLYYHSLRFFMKYTQENNLNKEYLKIVDEAKNLRNSILDGNTQSFFAFRKAYLVMSYTNLKNIKDNL